MINEIDIVNFQSHNSTHLELAPGVNVIVGASDSGKSAIIRALRWLIWNRPVGDAFIRHGTSGGFVNIVTDNYDVIQRSKGHGGNEYRINEEIFKAFGNDIPEPVQEILNMDETNLQQQLDSPFLISNTSGEVAQFFNKIAHLDQIDTGIRNIQSQIREITGQIQYGEDQLKTLQLEYKEYDYLDDFEKKLQTLEEKEKELLDLEQQEQTISTLLQQIEDIQQLLDENDEIIAYEKDVNSILETIEQREELLTEYTEIDTLVNSIASQDKHIEATQYRINNLEKEFKEQMPDICPLCNQLINK